MKICSVKEFLFIIFLSLSFSAISYAQLAAPNTASGSACDKLGASQITASSDGLTQVLYCNGTNWTKTFNSDLPTDDQHIANKAYVDLIMAGNIEPCTNDHSSLCQLSAVRSDSDPDFIPANIVNGANILNVVGTYVVPMVNPPHYTPPAGPSGCATIGSKCSGGWVFAGFNPVSKRKIFLALVDQKSPVNSANYTMSWKTVLGESGISGGSYSDGKYNTDYPPVITDFHAMRACRLLNADNYLSRADWYLPSSFELGVIQFNKDAIHAAGNLIEPFQPTTYWSSTEVWSDHAHAAYMGTAASLWSEHRTNHFRVRCIRSEA